MNVLPLIALVLGSLAVAWVCRRREVAPTLVLVVVGIAVSFIPGVPDFRIEPEVVLLLVLTPLLYSAALDSSYLGFRANIRAIGLLAVGLVVFTTAAVGLVAWWLVPGLPLPAALVLGAVVAPPDAVAAVAVGRRLGLPRRVMTILAGESLVNDATALTLFRVAVAAAAGAGVSLMSGVGMFLLAGVGGAAIGLGVGWVVHRVRVRLADPPIESALGLAVPFAVYIIAEEAHTSGLLAVVATGLYLGHKAPETGYATRLQDEAVWRASDTVLESVVFALIGLQLTSVVRELSGGSGYGAAGPLLLVGLALTAVAVLARVAWVYPATYLPRLVSKKLRRRDPLPNWRTPAVISWAGMRGVVSLAAAFAITPGVPYREALIFLAFVVTVATLMLHGMTLPWVIRRLGVRGEESAADALAEAQAQHEAGRAAVARLDELGQDPGVAQRTVDKLRYMAQMRTNSSWERLGRSAEEAGESPAAAHRRLRREMVAAEREVFIQHRDEGRIDDEVLRRVLRELDLEEAMLSRDD
ncbi:Na+/H+ antiporter [Pseudonocardia eucalypti]|uniref:Na+/H+ antiporter n=1 Tax=Pseudonocardia eucalypti TaxID=648755 RepID=A0ABP9R143_9PSEU|nr:CPA1 family monovalent cation:H+ antiporter [Pseudonocardia eucalypti]